MNDRTLAQHANALITKYVAQYKAKYGATPTINRYRDKWGFVSMIEDLGKESAGEVVEYYFLLGRDHNLIDLFRSYDEFYKMKLADEEDKRRVAKLQEETAQRVKEWKEKHGK